MTGLKDMTDEEFEKFMLENKDRIKKVLLKEDSELKDFIKGEMKSMKKKAKKFFLILNGLPMDIPKKKGKRYFHF
mgnify:CR=1 FL=1